MPLQCPPNFTAPTAQQDWIDDNNAQLLTVLSDLKTQMDQYNTFFNSFASLQPRFTRIISRSESWGGLDVGPFDVNGLFVLSGAQIDVAATLQSFTLNEFGTEDDTLGGEYSRRRDIILNNDPSTGVYNQLLRDSGGIAGINKWDFTASDFTTADQNSYDNLKLPLNNMQSIINDLDNLLDEFFALAECLELYNQNQINAAGVPNPGVSLASGSANQALANLQNQQIGTFTSAPTLSSPQIDFKEQCFLLAHIFNLAKIKERLDHGVSTVLSLNADGYKELPDVNSPRNRSVLVNGEPFGIVNTLTQSPSKSLFFEMTNAQLSTLQPKLRFFKVVPTDSEEETNCKEKEVEIIFDTHDLQDDITRMFSSNMGVRGIGVGLKSFDFSYEADNPFAIKKSISAKLVIHANTFSELLIERNNSTEPYSYIDLALRTGSRDTITFSGAKSQVHVNNLDKLNFKLKAVVGWQVPVADRGIFGPDLLNAIYDSSITLNLTPT